MKEQKRIEWFDYAKGIAIILVVYGHVLHEVFKTGLHAASGFCYWSDYVVYSFPMPLFFAVSGVLLSKQIVTKNSRTLLFSKFSSILYPYLIWSILQGGIEVFLSLRGANPISLSDLGLSLFWQPRAQFWFLHALFFMNVVAIVVCNFAGKNGVKAVLAVAITVYFLGSATLQGFEANFVYFAVGLLLGWDRVLSLAQQVTSGRIIVVTLFFIALEYLALSNSFDDYRLVRLIVAFAGIMFTVMWSVVAFKKNILLFVKTLGEKSLPIYLMHVLVYKVAFIVLFTLHIQRYEVFLATGIVAGLLIPAVLYMFLEKKDFLYLFTMNNLIKKK